MSELINAKFQFEIRYTYILDFESHYKSILSPYLKLATGMEIHGQNTRNEYIKLLFEEDGFSIDCRWDRMVFVSEDKLDNIKKNQSSLNKIFYEIFETISSLPSFGGVTNYVMVANGIKILENSAFDEIVENFIDQYLTDVASSHFKGSNKDVAISTDYTRNGIEISERFGPYNFKEDISRQKLLPFSKDGDNSDLHSNHGYMIRANFFEDTANIDFEETSNLIDEINILFEQYNKEIREL